jgi:hypothetical protein
MGLREWLPEIINAKTSMMETRRQDQMSILSDFLVHGQVFSLINEIDAGI